MKILMLADNMDVGGAETHIYELSRSLFSMGHEVKIFSAGGRTADMLGEWAELIEADAAKPFLRSFFRLARQLAEVLKKFKPDVIHAHTRRGLFLAEAVTKVMPFPLVFTAHAKFSATPAKRFFTRPPSYTIAVSEDIKRHFSSRFSAKSVEVIENGIDVERFSPRQVQKSGFRILTVSRLDKDSSRAAEILCAIVPRIENCEITVVGGGNDFDRINKLARKANEKIGREAIKCVGAQSDVLPFLRQAHIFVGVSRAALEAMSCGIPTIICGNEGFFGICHRDNFALCAKENFCARGYREADEKSLFEQISIIKSNASDPTLFVSDLVKNSFSAEKMAQRVLEIYKSATFDFSKSRRYDAVVCGYYGFGNLGDEIVLKKLLGNLKGLRVAVVGAMGGGRIWRFNAPKIIGAIRSSTLLVLGGGSLLQNATSNRSLKYYLALLNIAKFFGKKIMLYANGFGPVCGQGALEKCKRSLSAVDVASFRDAESMNKAKALLPKSTEVYLSRDPALSPLRPRRAERRIAVFIRGADYSPELASALAATLAPIKQRWKYEIVFASMNGKEDEKTAAKLADLMPFAASFRWFYDGERLTEFIASSEIIISSRLHAVILAASALGVFMDMSLGGAGLYT